ncbi:hypothetical protein [Pontibacter chitinilyticus]|uniref:hypothetical protein n=1 Tax=Pontibacter chitinilyticus TaxID=2674989 RepID=UPI00321BBE43
MAQDKKHQHRTNDRKNGLEWTVFTLSLLLVLAIFGYLGYQVYKDEPSSPDIYIDEWPDPSGQNPHRYQVLIHNKGGQTAETLVVEVALRKDGKDLEKAQLQIAFAPKESERNGWVNFEHDPAQADSVVAHVVSYKAP